MRTMVDPVQATPEATAPTGKFRPVRGGTPHESTRFRREQLEQYSARVRPFLLVGVALLPIGGCFDYFVTHASRAAAARSYPLVLSLLLSAICGASAIALRRARAARRPPTIARWIDLALTSLFAFYLSDRVVSVGGVYAYVTAGASLMAVLFVRALVMPSTWPRAAAVGVLVWVAYPLAWFAHGWVAGQQPGLPADELAVTVLGTVGLFFLISVTVSALGSQLLLGLRRSQFQAVEASRYHIERKLGGGGMGDVYLARHGTLKMRCAIKVCRAAGDALDGEMLRRFEFEAQQISRLKHPNVVRIFDYGEMENGALYYAMEHLPGMDLGQFLRQEGRPSEARLLRWAEQILWALQDAHSHGIIHRDLKPANVFLTHLGGEPDVIKVLDFGLVKLAEGRSASQDRITRANSITGTPIYMSPEQAQGLDSLDHRTDLYSLGVVLYELACGAPPFSGSDPMNVLVQHVTATPRPLREIAPAISVELEAAVHRLLAKSPAQRFPDARAAQIALRDSPHYNAWNRDQALSWWVDREPALEATGDEPAATVTLAGR